MVRLETATQALDYLVLLRASPGEVDLDVTFKGDLEFIRIMVDGPEFKHSITGELSRGLAAYQDEIYKAAKFALYGREGRFQLTQEQRKSFELVIEVRDGCTDLLAPVTEIAKGLAAGIANLEPAMLTGVVITVVLILTTAYAGVKIFSTIHETKQKKDALDAAVKQSAAMQGLAEHALSEQAAVAKVIEAAQRRAPVVQKFETAQTEGVKEILKSVPTAAEVTVGGVSFDGDDIRELRRRSPRAKSEYSVIAENFRVFADTSSSPVRLTLSGAVIPGEFNADFPDDINGQQEEALWQAIRSKGTIVLEVGATIIRDKIRSAVILDVVLPESQTPGAS